MVELMSEGPTDTLRVCDWECSEQGKVRVAGFVMPLTWGFGEGPFDRRCLPGADLRHASRDLSEASPCLAAALCRVERCSGNGMH